MAALPAALIFRFFLAGLEADELDPVKLFSSFCSASILSLSLAAFRNSFDVRFIKLMVGAFKHCAWFVKSPNSGAILKFHGVSLFLESLFWMV